MEVMMNAMNVGRKDMEWVQVAQESLGVGSCADDNEILSTYDRAEMFLVYLSNR
jgi:hypothetical protein